MCCVSTFWWALVLLRAATIHKPQGHGEAAHGTHIDKFKQMPDPRDSIPQLDGVNAEQMKILKQHFFKSNGINRIINDITRLNKRYSATSWLGGPARAPGPLQGSPAINWLSNAINKRLMFLADKAINNRLIQLIIRSMPLVHWKMQLINKLIENAKRKEQIQQNKKGT